MTDTHRFVAFGGARGGGKSWAVRVKAALSAFYHPGIKIMIVRKTYPELLANHIKPMLAFLPSAVRYSEVKKELSFPNGSEILFRYCDSDADADRYQGTEVDMLFIDEATQFTEDQWVRLRSCVRGVNDLPKRVYLTCNPGGVGSDWVKRLFIDREYRDGERAQDYSFIKSLVTDNEALMRADPDYVKRLEALPDKLRRAWLLGEWDAADGRFFTEFRDDPAGHADGRFSHVVDPFEIPRSWTVVRSFDFGYARPFSLDWWAQSQDGRKFLIKQYYGAASPNVGLRLDPATVFANAAEMETNCPELKGRRIIGVADPSIWDRSRGPSVADRADEAGLIFSPGDNKRLAGWMRCHEALRFDENGGSELKFFSTCRDAIRTLPLLTHSRSFPEDLDTDGEDHFADSMRYYLMFAQKGGEIK